MFYSHKQEKWIISLDRLQTSPCFLFGPRTVTFSVSPCQSGLLHFNYSLLPPVLSSWPASFWKQKPKPVLQMTSPSAEVSKQDYFMPAGCTPGHCRAPCTSMIHFFKHHDTVDLWSTAFWSSTNPRSPFERPTWLLPFWTCPADTPASVCDFSFASLAL